MALYHPDNALPTNGEIFVFGSNEAGIHSAGDALVAKQKYGARAGICGGYMTKGPNKHCYGIPTKDKALQTLPLDKIKQYVDEFKMAAIYNRTFTYFVPQVGCDSDDYQDWQIAHLFNGCGSNVILPEGWKPYIRSED